MNDLFEMIFYNLPFPMWVKDDNYKYIYVNRSFSESYNITKEELLNRREDEFLLESIEVAKNREAKLISIKIQDIINKCFIFPIMNDKKELVAICGMILEENSKTDNSIVEKIMDLLPGVIFYKDKNSRYIYANKGCRDFYKDRGIDNIIGKTDEDINENIELVQKFMKDDKKIIESKTAIYNEAVFVNENGEKQYKEVVKIPLLDSKGNVSGIVGRSMDVTEKRIAQERLQYLSYTDVLTEVYNRAYFEERIQELSKSEYLPLGIIMGDANGLKKVNDTFGHQEGDKLIKQTAKTLLNACKGIGEVFRIGGDEFVILVPNVSFLQCDEIIKNINEMCDKYESKLFKLSISLGYSVKNSEEESTLKVLKEADDKVYVEKAKIKTIK